MGILDEAIREHLELKRAHGAGDDELKQLEDEAFGQAERPGGETPPDPFAEAPTEFMTQPGAEEGAEEPTARREPTIADLQEPPELGPESEAAEEEIEPSGPTTEERHAIAEQPTEMFDVEEELGPPSPTDEQLVEEEIAEPRLAPTDPLAGLEEGEEAEVTIEGPAPDDDEEYEDEDDAFWNEQRLSDELDQALEAPRETEVDVDVDGETDTEAEVEEPEPEHEDESESEVDEEPESDEYEEPQAEAEHVDEDVLEETPDFLEETPEDDQLWFEQKPPKDFDFDD